MGFGGVGRRIAEVVSPFKTRILATDMFPVDKPAHVEALWPAERLDDLLDQSRNRLSGIAVDAADAGTAGRQTARADAHPIRS